LLISCCWSADLFVVHDYVNDEAHVLSTKVVQDLNARLKKLDETESTQLVIVTLPSLNGQPLEQVSLDIANNNKIGNKHLNNGILFLLAMKERSLRIEVGRGFEGILTDLLTGSIIDHEMLPHFARGDFDQGFEQGIDKVMLAIKGQYHRIPLLEIQTFIAQLFCIAALLFFYADCRKTLEKRKSIVPYRFFGTNLLTLGLTTPYWLFQDLTRVAMIIIGISIITHVLNRYFDWFYHTMYYVNPEHVKPYDVTTAHSSYRGKKFHQQNTATTHVSTFKGGGGSFGGGGASGRF
jgi:uncharacterized membrane protein YgcG